MIDLLEDTKKRLERNHGHTREISRRSGLAYDTILRIKRGNHSPRYKNLMNLWETLVRFDAERGQ